MAARQVYSRNNGGVTPYLIKNIFRNLVLRLLLGCISKTITLMGQSKPSHNFLFQFFLLFRYFIQILLYLFRVFLSIAYLTVAYLVLLGILVDCQVSVRSHYLVRLISLCQITGGCTIDPPIQRLLSITGTEPTELRNSASKVAGLQVHATTFLL